MDFFGLDIGSYSIKVAQVKQDKSGELRLLAIGRGPSPARGMESDAEGDLVKVAETIKKLLLETRIMTRQVVAAIPESEVVTKILNMPEMKEEELMEALKFEAEAFIPFPLKEANFDFQILLREKKQMRVMIVAAPKRLVNRYLEVLTLAELKPLALETETMALGRAIVPGEFPPCLVVDLGAKTCDLVIIEAGSIFFSRSVPTAGRTFTRALAAALSLEELQAEEYKRAFGLAGGLEDKVQKSLTPVFEVLANEMKKTIQFYGEERKDQIRKIILAGGSAGLPEVASFITQKLGLEVLMANPFLRLTFDKSNFPGLTEEGALFAVAIGLAERQV